MATSQRTSQSQRQTTALTPRMRLEQSRLIGLSPAELEQDIEKKLLENPALELAADDSAQRSEDGRLIRETPEEQQRKDYWESDDDPNPDEADYRAYSRGAGEERPRYELRDDDTPTIDDYLREQLLARSLTDKQRSIIDNIIGNLDARGYLKRDVRQIAGDMAADEVSVAEVDEMVNLVRSLEPPGIAAINLQDCLLLQLERMDATPDVDMAYAIVADHIGELEERQWAAIAAAMGVAESEVTRVTRDVLGRLSPSPAAGFASPAEASTPYIEPQYTIEIDDVTGTIVATVNSRFPELQVSQSYKSAADSEPARAAMSRLERQQRKTMRENVDSAEFYIRMIKVRQQTLRDILDYIVRHQRDFLLSGDPHDLHPMVLREIADSLGMDTSTVSRATSDSYVQSPYGLLPMRSFFITEGDNIKPVLRSIIAAEDKSAPLTDDQLVESLAGRGYTVARRTVVKYRKEMGIANSRERGLTPPPSE